MLARNPTLSSDHPDHALAAHRARVAECRSVLDKAIPLGIPDMPAFEARAVERYYAAKERRYGTRGQYFLHHAKTFSGRMSRQ